jgi:hypothetical protein
MLKEKTQIMSLQAFLLERRACYESVTRAEMEGMFQIEGEAVQAGVNALILQGLLCASWNEDCSVLILTDVLPNRLETMSLQLLEKVNEMKEVNEENRGGKKDENGKNRNRKQFGVFAQRNMKVKRY